MTKTSGTTTNPTPKNGDHLEKALDGGKWYLMNVMMQKVFIFCTFFILARLLTPADFGIIAIASIFPTIIDTVTALAFDTVVVQMKKDEERPYLNAIWTFGVIRGVFIFFLVFLSAHTTSLFFQSEQTLPLFTLGGFVLFVQGFANIGQIYFFKNLEFKKVFLRDLAIQFTTSSIAITGALFLHSYWALFLAQAGAAIVGTISTYVLNDYRPRFDLQIMKLRPLFSYGRWVYGQEVLNQATLNLENILVGRFSGATDLGLLTKAKGLAQIPTSVISAIFKEVSFSAFASIQDSHERIRNGLYRSIDLIAGVAIPFFAGIYIAGDRLIALLLGKSWIGITPLLYIVIIPITLNAIASAAIPIFNATGNPKSYFYIRIISLIANALPMIFLVPVYGVYGVVYSMLIASLIVNTVIFLTIHHIIRLNLLRIGGTIGIIAMATCFPVLVSLYLLKLHFTQSVIGFLCTTLLMALLYIAAIIFSGKVFPKGPSDTLLLIFRSLKKRADRDRS